MRKRVIRALAEKISHRVRHFNKAETECLIEEFQVMVRDLSISGTSMNGLDREMFTRMLHYCFGLTDEMIMDRVFRIFDKDNDHIVTVEEWIAGLAIFLRGNLDEKIKYCFSVYDLNNDHHISREEMFRLLKDCLVQQPTDEDPDEGIRDIIEVTLKKTDYDRDGRISFGDFEKAVKEEMLFLQAFGTCLPDPTSVEVFEQNVFPEKLKQ